MDPCTCLKLQNKRREVFIPASDTRSSFGFERGDRGLLTSRSGACALRKPDRYKVIPHARFESRRAVIPQEFLELLRQNEVCPTSYAYGNPWSRPPAAVMRSGVVAALGWWEDVKRYGLGKSHKLKAVLVGLAEAGKTTIVRHLTGGPLPEHPDRTVGIEITPAWRPSTEDPLQVNVWDFAGQADYYSSHQLFLTKGALFLLVVDLRAFFEEVQSGGVDNFTDRRDRIYLWLEMLHIRVPGAAIALVGSHVDQMERADVARARPLLHAGE